MNNFLKWFFSIILLALAIGFLIATIYIYERF